MDTKPTSIVIFGGTGDLARRKLLPGLYNLYRKGRLPANFQIIGTSRSTWDAAEFRRHALSGIQAFSADSFDSATWDDFSVNLDYLPGNLTEYDDYVALQAMLRRHENGDANRLYYLAIAPRFFTEVVTHLGALDMLSEDHGWRRVIVEKPFGHDLASARALNTALHNELAEHQIYRIDHYLAKETVQNLMVLRFGNAIFEPLWNRNYVESVQITAAESVDVGHRAGYYDSSGVLRDMFQNHLLQLLTLTAMEPPASFDADAIRNEKVKVLASVRPLTDSDLARRTVRAQYDGYCEAEGVADNSTTATYAALALYIDNWRWQGVPFYLRSGKALPQKATEITVQFKRPPMTMFPDMRSGDVRPNVLSICVQPDEGIHLRFEAKRPDTTAEMASVDMEFHYADTFGAGSIPEAYEKLLLEAIEGDASLFTRADSIELAWGIIDPILTGWDGPHGPPLRTYAPGTWGPDAADALLGNNGHGWLLGCGGH